MSTHQYILADTDRSALGGAERSRLRLRYVSCAHYSKEWASQLHSHTCAELFFITGGHGDFLIREERFPVAVSDMMVVNAGIPHTEPSQNGSPMEYVVLGVEGLETITDASGYTLLHLFAEDAIDGCLRTLTQEIREPRKGCDEICQRLLEIILLHLLRRDDFALSDAAPAASGSSRECNQVRRYIDNHFKENLTLDQLAGLAHINKYYLSHAFRREFNISPISYLISRRIQESRFLLAETDHSLSQIAQILGFSSLSYFSQSFRRQEGMSPMELPQAEAGREPGGGVRTIILKKAARKPFPFPGSPAIIREKAGKLSAL